MKLLLDSHVLIWWASSSEKISKKVYNIINDTNNTLLFSLASVWEMQIKFQLGKLNLNSNLPTLIDNQQRVNNLQLLPIELNHIYALNNLPPHHKDPFDRLLIAQAIVEKIPLASIDEVFDNYPIQRLW
ncbi:MAG: type II toxin-antitoxin system VapC family toxin [Cyanobacteria bacterium J06628_3]